MKKVVILLVMSIIIFSLGCGGNDKQNVQKENTATEAVHKNQQVSKEGEEEEVAGKLVLNNGNKWQANPETTKGIQKMQALVDNYLNAGDADNKKLSENLETEFTTILQNCTMSGEAHAQLHNFLLPLKGKIDKLKENQGIIAVKEIQSYLKNFTNYFQ